MQPACMLQFHRNLSCWLSTCAACAGGGLSHIFGLRAGPAEGGRNLRGRHLRDADLRRRICGVISAAPLDSWEAAAAAAETGVVEFAASHGADVA